MKPFVDIPPITSEEKHVILVKRLAGRLFEGIARALDRTLSPIKAFHKKCKKYQKSDLPIGQPSVFGDNIYQKVIQITLTNRRLSRVEASLNFQKESCRETIRRIRQTPGHQSSDIVPISLIYVAAILRRVQVYRKYV
jgi:hypothetical protein